MLPGRTFTPEDVLGILRRRYWLILVPFAVTSAAMAVHARRLPDVYQSDALISVQPPKVPETVVRPMVATRIEERIPAIRNEILSRTRLERIIQDLNLYPDERRTGIMEDIVESMRGRIGVVPVGGSAIRVSFSGSDPRTVQRVTERLSALFMDESTRDRKLLVENTDQFLETSVKATEERLQEKERTLQEYRQRHNGELPEQLTSNLQAAQNQQLQIQALNAQADRDAERRLALEKSIEELENQTTIEAGDQSPTARQLAAARAQLLDLQINKLFKPDHPDVQRVAKIIRDLKHKLDLENREAPMSGADAITNPSEVTRLRRLADARAQLEQLDKQAKRNQDSLAQSRQAAVEYLRRAEAAPTRQTEMTSMTRDYNTISQLYSGLLGQKEQSGIAANMERREIGETFKLVDAARVPARPSSPNRSRLNMMGMATGFAIGICLVGLLEYRDSTFRVDDELTRVLGLPVLAVVPLMRTEAERRRNLQTRLALNAVLGSGVAACLAVVIYTFVR